MKKLFWILILVSAAATAQELDTVSVDTVTIDTMEVEPPTYYLGIYLEAGVSWEPSVPDPNLSSLIGVGIQYQRWTLGFSRLDFQGNVQSRVVFPNIFELRYAYAGPNLAYQFYGDKNQFTLHLIAAHYLGDMVWRNQEDDQDFLRDEFSITKIGLKGELGKFRYVKPWLTIGYQKMDNLKLNQLAEKEFSGLFVAAGIRIGYFNQ